MTYYQPPKEKPATGIIAWYMRKKGYHGLATIWDTIYYLDGAETNEGLRKHEWAHIDQMERDGKFIWAIKYFYYQLRYGYIMNPYEIEARKAAHEP